MNRDPRQRARRCGGALTLALVAALASTARGDGLSIQLNPGYSASRSTTTDETGRESTVDSSTITQRYRASLDKPLYPTLTLSLGGSLDWLMGTSEAEGVTREADVKRWNGFARLRAGDAVLSGALDYDHQERETTSSGTGLPETSSALLRDAYGGAVSWRPADLPTLDLRLSRTEVHDRTRSSTDITTDDALVSTRYEPTRGLDLRYSVRAARITDHLSDVRTSELNNSAAVVWTSRYLGGRGTTYVSYTVGATDTTVTARGSGGTVSTVQLPVAGLSLVEVFPALPTRVTLEPNSALVDGVTGVSAGINLGYSATSSTGERPLRDLGAQFASATTPVNAIHVYVDRTLPEDVSVGFTWTVYESDDNVDWVQVGGAVIAPFDPLLNRFEIPVERRAARYLKVVTRPLPATPGASPLHAEIFVTELQLLLVVPAQQAAGTTSTMGGNLNASTKFRIIDSSALSLSYDLSTLVTHTDSGERVTYAIVNGLSASRRLTRTVGTAARVERTDTDAGRGHDGLNRWSGTLTYDPIPALGTALVYSGQLSQLDEGNAISQTLAASARADLYQGIATSASVSVSVGSDENGRDSRSTSTSATTTLSPNSVLSLSGSVGYTDAEQTGGGQPDRTDQRGLLEGTASVTPFRALVLSGTVTRVFGRTVASQTLASFGAAFSPFEGGDLQLRYSYQETIDTSGDQRTRTHGPALRWNIRRGWFLDAGYSFLDSRTPAQDSESQFFFTSLTIALR